MSKQECISKIIVEHCRLHKDLKILNENTNECMICCNKFEGNIVQVRNNLCKCFNTVLLCEKCFVTWFIHDNKCFICRKLYLSKNSNNKYEMYHFKHLLILLKLKAITNDKKIVITISDDSISIDNSSESSNLDENENHIIENNNIENNIRNNSDSIDNLEVSNNPTSLNDTVDINTLSRKICITYIKCFTSIGFILTFFFIVSTFIRNEL
jgi:hypothetical protein|tara:strand:+ start:401 stop:1033 length:633 start_codon:yes stop_codon:yes gene_type:complete